MSIPIKKIVKVNIKRSPKGEDYFSFGTGCILGTSETIKPTERYKKFYDIDEVKNVFDVKTPEYKAAQVYFAQPEKPDVLIIAVWDKKNEKTPDIALNDLVNKCNDWYGLMLASEEEDDNIINIAEWAEPQDYKFFMGTSSDDKIFDIESKDDIASKLKKKNVDWTALFGHPTVFPALGSFAKFAVINWNQIDAAITLKFKRLNLVSPNDIVTAKRDIAVDEKNCNVYVTYGKNSDMVDDGRCCSGEWIDTIVGVDVLRNSIEIDLFNLLYKSPTKIPLTDRGGAKIEAELRKTLDKFRRNGFIAENSYDNEENFLPLGYSTYVQPVREMSEADKDKRRAPNVTFKAVIAGAIHSIIINGTVI